ncbi:ABC transporter substrate-binding protein [Thiohalocapsa halophila]|uniref:High-affinity zinc uptake system protein ZnuA n=1 Tax=Thiohalocapsa halophila TaxID=69359 RepID=A0ABS1CJI9_9GAMM|nr:zinc ABC transporter substrate-binding protein [Thiohalocapsa halophila]MBK1631977.1 ABC transporter substrate-binding protein [Thiohalocapsa halophila]
MFRQRAAHSPAQPPRRSAGLLSWTLLAIVLAVASTAGAAQSASNGLSVFASVLPLANFAERVGGERVQVHTMVQPGHSPATYEPTPRQITALAEADLYLRVGAPFEDAWMKRIRSTNPDMRVVDLRNGLDLRAQPKHDHGDSHHHQPDQPAMDHHIWTSPQLVRQMTETIRDAFSELDPAGAYIYAVNQAAFDAELAALDTKLQERLSGLDNRSFLVYHPAWGYFADAYGLTQVPIEQEGKEPGARRLTALIEQARQEDARVILVQPQFDQRAAEQVARAIDGRVETVDPLSPNYAATLRRLADILVAADSGRGPTGEAQAQ